LRVNSFPVHGAIEMADSQFEMVRHNAMPIRYGLRSAVFTAPENSWHSPQNLGE